MNLAETDIAHIPRQWINDEIINQIGTDTWTSVWLSLTSTMRWVVFRPLQVEISREIRWELSDA